MGVQKARKDNFEELLKNPAVLLKVGATWCGFCRAISPKIERVAEELGEKVAFVDIDLEEIPEIKEKFEFQTIPALFFIKNGEVTKHTGTIPEEEIKSTLEGMINS